MGNPVGFKVTVGASVVVGAAEEGAVEGCCEGAPDAEKLSLPPVQMLLAPPFTPPTLQDTSDADSPPHAYGVYVVSGSRHAVAVPLEPLESVNVSVPT